MWSFSLVSLIILHILLHCNSFRHFRSSICTSQSYINKLHGSMRLQLMEESREDLRNVAIIAHVDHGKTTLVDAMMKQSGSFRSNQEIASMDSNDQEKERGITILAKNAAIMYGDKKINIVDTPGHADFGGEVERIMNMVDGVLLVVDSVDGPKPQTRFVLKKALEKGVRAIVVINKCDRPNTRPDYVLNQVYQLFMDLNANEEQLEFQIVYASGLQGKAGLESGKLDEDLKVLFDEILKLPKAKVDKTKPLQLLIANIDIDTYLGKMGIGRIMNGRINVGDEVQYGKPDQTFKRGKISELFVFNNVGREKIESAYAGDIVMVSGLSDITIGDTIMDKTSPTPLPPISVELPTVRMSVRKNTSPFAGKEGTKVESMAIKERLFKEMEKNVALKVTDLEIDDTYEICGRGQLHLTVLIETMRREGFEMMIGPPTVIEKKIDGVTCEPFEVVDCTVPDEYASGVVNLFNVRKGEMVEMGPCDGSEGQTQLQFIVPSRGMIGIRNHLLTLTRGNLVLDTAFHSYRPHVGNINSRSQGSLLAHEEGVTNPYGIEGAQERGQMFVQNKEPVYKDQIIGIHCRNGDLAINVCKQKKLTNMRAAGSDDTTKISPPIEVNLDMAVEYIQDDELVEVTPKSVRMCKHPNYKEWQKIKRSREQK